jgi:hypothetical protein
MLKKLLGKFLDDVEKGIDPTDAGWTEDSISELQQLIEKRLCETKNTKVRVAFRPLDREVLKDLDEEGEWLAEVHQEIVYAKNMLDEIIRTVNDPSLQPAVIFLGWKRMLATSGFPVLIDRVLQEGFTIDEWVPVAIMSSDALSLMVVKKWWNEDEIMKGLNKLSAAKEVKSIDSVEKVINILKWNQAVTLLDKNLTLTLGILWFADSEIVNLLYPESLVYIQMELWKILEKIIGEKSETIRNNFINVVKAIENVTSESDKLGRSCPIAQWTFIIRMPW